MFVITKFKVEGYEVTINRSVCDIYKTSKFFVCLFRVKFLKLKKLRLEKKRIIHAFVKYLNLLMTGSQAVFLYVMAIRVVFHFKVIKKYLL